ncbi:MAG TPA: glycosyltransferase [Candidatus Paenibacillus intestinavium]|nr:glycosyltransferase [Candidatus Paenibacillus intestinavium]
MLSNYSPVSSLYNINIKKIDYVIYSSQYRPYKNIFNLIKAIKNINKEMHCNIKLIITSDFREDQRIMSYINDNHLANDIFVMHGLSSEVLASFSAHAKCAVNPTLFEGGFPFTFSEAYSVGTPSVMSNIPVVRAEIYNENLSQMMLFDPYNPYSMAKKIIWAVENCDELYQEQSKLYDKFAQRDWEKVVNEYNQVFEKFMR